MQKQIQQDNNDPVVRITRAAMEEELGDAKEAEAYLIHVDEKRAIKRLVEKLDDEDCNVCRSALITLLDKFKGKIDSNVIYKATKRVEEEGMPLSLSGKWRHGIKSTVFNGNNTVDETRNRLIEFTGNKNVHFQYRIPVIYALLNSAYRINDETIGGFINKLMNIMEDKNERVSKKQKI